MSWSKPPKGQSVFRTGYDVLMRHFAGTTADTCVWETKCVGSDLWPTVVILEAESST